MDHRSVVAFDDEEHGPPDLAEAGWTRVEPAASWATA